jgi:hypothetical protein
MKSCKLDGGLPGMSLDDLEREEEDRVRYELQMLGQDCKRAKVYYGIERRRGDNKNSGSVKVVSTENYRLTLEDVTGKR